jgi:serine phosphatase RsbU (regulator of sigma subunit)
VAFTIQDETGRIVYANDAAADSLGFRASPDVTAVTVGDVAGRFLAYREDGSPVRLADLPGRRALAGEEPEPLLLRTVHRETGEERWRLVKTTLVPGRSGERRLAVNVIEDVTEVKQAELAQRLLAEAGAALASAPDYEQTLARIAELAVGRLADWCTVSLPDGHGRLRSVAVAHADPDKRAVALALEAHNGVDLSGDSASARALLEVRSQHLRGVPPSDLRGIDEERRAAVAALGVREALMVPMPVAGRAIGIMTFGSAESGRAFSPADVALMEELGRRAGTAVENARLYQERSHIAATLQRGLLPDALPSIPGVGLASLYRPAGAENLVGGDFYDAFPSSAGWMVLIGDVTGRGAEAAALTGQARHTLRTAGTLLGRPEVAFEQLNQALAVRAELTPCTVVLVQLAPDLRTARVLCAGHPQPVLVRGGEVHLVGRFGPMLGAWVDSHWHAETIALEPGDVLVLYSDGVTDTVGPDGRFGEERLLAALADAAVGDAEAAVEAVDRALRAFETGEQADDTAVLALHVP